MEAQHPAHFERQYIVVPVADNGRKLPAPFQFLREPADGRRQLPLGIETAEAARTVDEIDRAVTVIADERNTVAHRNVFPRPQHRTPLGVINYRSAVHAVAPHEPEHPVRVEANAQYIVGIDSAERFETRLGGDIPVQTPFIQEERLVTAPCRILVNTREVGMQFGGSGPCIDPVDPIVGAHPQVAVVRSDDLLHQVTGKPEVPGIMPVPKVQSVTTPGPDISVRILRKREDGTIRKPLAVRDTANILGQRRYRDAHGDQQQIPQVHKTVR